MPNQQERKYKDTIFTLLFGEDKEALLSLYNALNNTDYDDPNILEINTIESAIYMGIRNDVSFIIGDELNLYEHQASVNPNMPLRFLRYLSDVYRDYVKDKNMYSSGLIELPTPRFVVFYNGTRIQEEKYEYKLSDAYIQKSDSYQLELKVDVYNINPDNNEDIKRACKLLGEYTIFVETVRRKLRDSSNSKCYENLHQSLKESIDECIMRDILKDFLNAHKQEVLDMDWLYEFDEEVYEKMVYNSGFEDGRKLGLEDGRKLGLEDGKKLGERVIIESALQKGKTPEEIADFNGIPLESVLEIEKDIKNKI